MKVQPFESSDTNPFETFFFLQKMIFLYIIMTFYEDLFFTPLIFLQDSSFLQLREDLR